jgi:hypothetical protein
MGCCKSGLLKCYNALEEPVRADQELLREQFVTEFRENGGESKILQSLSNVCLRQKDSARKLRKSSGP